MVPFCCLIVLARFALFLNTLNLVLTGFCPQKITNSPRPRMDVLSSREAHDNLFPEST